MKLEEQVCSLELAKKLKELGIKQNSQFYFCNVKYIGDEILEKEVTFISHLSELALTSENCFSAFTSAELGEMLPHFLEEESASRQDAILEIIKDGENRWLIAYVIDENLPPKIAVIGNNEAEARAQMLIYLIENNYEIS